jgi:hypothetical protein
MVSMVIVLFLTAIAISLIFGRLAEILANRFRERLQPQLAAKYQSVQEPDGRGNKVASRRPSRNQVDLFHSLPVGAGEK